MWLCLVVVCGFVWLFGLVCGVFVVCLGLVWCITVFGVLSVVCCFVCTVLFLYILVCVMLCCSFICFLCCGVVSCDVLLFLVRYFVCVVGVMLWRCGCCVWWL